MGLVRHDLRVPATPEQVWAAFADLNRLPDWLTLHVKFKSAVPAPDEYRVGLQVTEVLSVLGMPNTVEWTVEEYTPLTSVTLTGLGMAGVKATFVLSVAEADGATTGSMVAEFTGAILVGPIGKAVEAELDKHLRTSLGNLADLLVREGVIAEADRDQVQLVAPAA